MTVNTDGSSLRPAVESPQRNGGGYFHWSPQLPNVFYTFGSYMYYPWQKGPDLDTLYKVIVSKSSTMMSTPLIENAPRGQFNKLISADGKKAVIFHWNDETAPALLYPVILWPDKEATVLVPKGYSVDRHFGPFGNTPNSVIRYHDNYLPGDGSWIFAMPSGSATWWRIKTVGSAADSGASTRTMTANTTSAKFGRRITVRSWIPTYKVLLLLQLAISIPFYVAIGLISSPIAGGDTPYSQTYQITCRDSIAKTMVPRSGISRIINGWCPPSAVALNTTIGMGLLTGQSHRVDQWTRQPVEVPR